MTEVFDARKGRVEFAKGENVLIYCNTHHSVLFTRSLHSPMFESIVDFRISDHLSFFKKECNLDVFLKDGDNVTVIPGSDFLLASVIRQ